MKASYHLDPAASLVAYIAVLDLRKMNSRDSKYELTQPKATKPSASGFAGGFGNHSKCMTVMSAAQTSRAVPEMEINGCCTKHYHMLFFLGVERVH